MKFRSIGIAVAMLLSLSLFGMVKSSQGFEIEEMYPSYGGYYDYTGNLYHSAYVKTDEPFFVVDWYINEKYIDSSWGDNVTTDAYFSPNNLDYPGSPFGISYTIKARAWPLEDDADGDDSDTESYSVTVYTYPKTETQFGNHTGAELYASIDVGWNGHSAEVTASASVKSYSENQIGYGFNLSYKVVRLTPNGNWAADLWTQPPGLWRGGALQAEKGEFDIAYYTPDSNSMDLRGGRLNPGNYRVEGHVTASANIGENVDNHTVSDSEDLHVPENPLNE